MNEAIINTQIEYEKLNVIMFDILIDLIGYNQEIIERLSIIDPNFDASKKDIGVFREKTILYLKEKYSL